MKLSIVISFLIKLIFFVPDSNIFSQQLSTYELVIYSGAIERKNTVVSFYVPSALSPGTYRLISETIEQTLLQVDNNNTGWMILDELPRYTERRFILNPENIIMAERELVRRTIDENKITFTVNGNDVIGYFHKEQSPPEGVDPLYARAGYIHPVRTPGGIIVTQDFAEVHPHHHGIWTAWTNVGFDGRNPDFWNVGKETGGVEFESLDITWEGAVQSGFRSRHRYVDYSSSSPVTALNEQWEVRLYNITGDYHIFDIKIIQTANTDYPVILPEYPYGGIGFRGHEDWEGEDNAFFLTSEGYTRKDGFGTSARWCHIGGYTGNNLAGLAIFDHPGNFRHPQPVHIHPTRTFFNFAAPMPGDMRIEPGTPYIMQYRFIVFDGESDKNELERLWTDYAYPPAVFITRITDH